MNQDKAEKLSPTSYPGKFLKIELYIAYAVTDEHISLGSLLQSGEIAYANPAQNQDPFNWDNTQIPLSELKYSNLEKHITKSVKKYLKKNRTVVWPPKQSGKEN